MKVEWIHGVNRLAVLLLMASAPCQAELPRDPLEVQKLFDLDLTDLVNIQVTSSTLTEKSRKTVPASVTVFTRDQIRNLGTAYLNDLLNFVPGFQSYRAAESSVEYFHSARGHRTSVASREVLILVDGVRYNRDYDNAMAVPMLSLHNVEKIEFIRGPGSAIYGSNAYLGVIVISTSKERNEVQLATGAFDNKELAALGYLDLHGWQINAAAHGFSDTGQAMVLQNFFTLADESGKDPRRGNDLSLSVGNTHTTLSARYSDRRSEEFYVSERTSNPTNEYEHKHSDLQFAHVLEWQPALRSEFSLSYSKNSSAAQGDLGPVGISSFYQDERVTNARLQNDWDFRDDWSAQFGLEYRYSDYSDFLLRTGVIGDLTLYPADTQQVQSAYAQTQYQFDAGVELVLGARYDDYNHIASTVNPRLGVVIPLASSQTIKLLYGEAFRAPTPNELKLSTPGNDVQGNPDLKPEEISTWEAIWLGQWQRVSLTLNGFYNVMHNTIVRSDSATAANFVNSDQDESFYGFEADLDYQITDRLLISATSSHFRGLPDADLREAKTLGSLIVNYQSERWNLNVSSTYTGKRDMLVNNPLAAPEGYQVTLDAYWQLHSKLQYALTKNLTLFTSFRNLLDEKFDTPTQRAVHTDPVPNRGLEWSIGFNLASY